MENKIAFSADYGFIGVKYLSEKYHYPAEQILNLFIECDYSITRTVEFLEKSTIAAA